MAKEINGTRGTWALRVSGVLNIVTAIVTLLFLLATAILAPSARNLIDGNVFYDSHLYERGLAAFGVRNLLYLYAGILLLLVVVSLFYGIYALAKAKHSNRRIFFIISGIVLTLLGLSLLFLSNNELFVVPTVAAIFMIVGGIMSGRAKPLSENQQAAQDYQNQWGGTGYQHGSTGYQQGGYYGGYGAPSGQYGSQGGYPGQQTGGYQSSNQNYQHNAYDTAYTGDGYGWQGQYQHGQQAYGQYYGQQHGQPYDQQYGQQYGQQAQQYGQDPQQPQYDQYGQHTQSNQFNEHEQEHDQQHDQQAPEFAWQDANSSVEDYNLDKMDEVLGTSSTLEDNSKYGESPVEPSRPESSFEPTQPESLDEDK